jgi:hypothetical protein
MARLGCAATVGTRTLSPAAWSARTTHTWPGRYPLRWEMAWVEHVHRARTRLAAHPAADYLRALLGATDGDTGKTE